MKKEFIEKHYQDLIEILNCVKVGIYITDPDGNTVLVNDESCKTGGLTREELMGKNVRDLVEQGFWVESTTLQTLKSGVEEHMIQHLRDGTQIYVTGTPFYKESKLDMIVCTERDITETLSLRELLTEQNEANEKYKSEIEYLKMQNIIMRGNLIAEDEESKKTAEQALRIAKLDTTILLTGESGTGKEVYANFIYQNSNRVGKPFIKINCAAIPEHLLESELFGYEKGSFTGADKSGKIGFFEMANHGTIFLDEIGEIPVQLQSKLLRVIQEKEVMRIGGEKVINLDVRLIAATNRDLMQEVQRGRFRGDLYYRLNIMPILITPLKGKRKDIRALTLYFVERFNKEYILQKTIEESAIQELQNYSWPGNIRELENIIERIMISFDGQLITRIQVEQAIGKRPLLTAIREEPCGKTLQELLEAYEKEILLKYLERFEKPSKVGRQLEINKSTLSRKMKKYGI